ncbi:INP51 [Candida pseudojiufengensis]|uniref:INP51 n=1 Tax=Candida pseudojiufengensis TaxID=497109 RepID=UPI0022252D49|nr:INP51 [Candida pseudojiufengensis]KAI5966927.1 INP51 [Candida pseudojiufengensis]
MRLYLKDKPRTFIVTTSTHALIIRHPSPTYKHRSIRGLIQGHKSKYNEHETKVLVEFVKKEYIDLSSYRDVTPKRNKLIAFLGLLSLKNKVFLGFINRDELVASPTIEDQIYKITGTEFHCLNNDEYDYIYDKDYDESSYQDSERIKFPAASVRKLLSSGAFFYSRQFDITSTIQERGVGNFEFKLVADVSYFTRFSWNNFMMSELLEFRNRLTANEQIQIDKSGFLIIIARGYAKTVNTYIGENEALMTLISKQSCAKQGPIFGDWGCDGDGSVANYVESELIIYTEKFCLSYIIARGNVPMYWELSVNSTSKSLIAGSGKRIIFPRSFEASQEAFTRHIESLSNQYGDVHIINELSDKSYKGVLNASFEEQIKYYLKNKDTSNSDYKLKYTHLPIPHSRIRKVGYTAQNPSDIVNEFSSSAVSFGALFFDRPSMSFIGKQLGIFRINSFDSLSKANFLSKIISQEIIELAFGDIGIELERELYTKHAKLWQENDYVLTKLTLNFVSTTDKLQTSNVSHAASVKSHITKKYLNGVVDTTKPNELALLKLLGRLQDQTPINLHNPLHDYIAKELSKHKSQFTTQSELTVFASTFNLNGELYDGTIEDWIYPKGSRNKVYDLVFIGLQEIVELKPGQMINTDSRNKTQWERKILEYLLKRDKYLVMWSGQLGGLVLFFFVKESQMKYISNAEFSFKKTGLGGVAANKGGVAVSFTFSDTSMCFVSSHFAAGLTNNEERHHNYKTLIKGIQFSKNRRIPNHDCVIWLGDLNYRLSPIQNDQVQSLIAQKSYNKLFEFDQLNQQMASGEAFPFFTEQEISFPPTYKFDNGTKVYDTSEKQRIPAWTDRILYLSRKNLMKPIEYNYCEDLVFSDHRPVYAIFQITVQLINQSIKKQISNQLYDNFKIKHGGLQDISSISYDLDKKSIDFDNENLPPPSSDKYKWWLDGGKPAKVSIASLNDDPDLVINPFHPINPFAPTNEPEFVSSKDLEGMLN